MGSQLTMREILEKKSKLQADILSLVEKFESETELPIDRVFISTQGIGVKELKRNVEVTITL